VEHWYSVLIERRGDDASLVTDDAMDVLLDVLQPHHAVVIGGGGHALYGARMSVESASPVAAVNEASVYLRCGAIDAGLPEWSTVRAEAVREDVLAEDLAHPQLPDLVSVPEVAEILGVTPQRVHTLTRDNKRFPSPAYHLKTGKIWLRPAIEKFAAGWDRKPGRPRNVA
jgi:hypothetical protein